MGACDALGLVLIIAFGEGGEEVFCKVESGQMRSLMRGRLAYILYFVFFVFLFCILYFLYFVFHILYFVFCIFRKV